MRAIRDRSTQTMTDVTADNSASSPTVQSQPPRSHFSTQTFGLPTPTARKVTSFTEFPVSTSFWFDSDDDDENRRDLLLCGRCGAKLTTYDAMVARYLTLRELTPQPSDDVIESRDRQARASRNRTSTSLPTSLRHQQAATDDAVEKVHLCSNTLIYNNINSRVSRKPQS